MVADMGGSDPNAHLAVRGLRAPCACAALALGCAFARHRLHPCRAQVTIAAQEIAVVKRLIGEKKRLSRSDRDVGLDVRNPLRPYLQLLERLAESPPGRLDLRLAVVYR